nr:immunoglobulin heavy chain junction region [Mus musculus]
CARDYYGSHWYFDVW